MTEYGERIDPDDAHPRLLAEHLERYRFASAFVGGGYVLDVASGNGYGASILEHAGARLVLQIEIDPDAVRRARATAPSRTRVVRADAQVLPLADGSIGACVCLETVEHLSDPSALIRELARVVVRGGTLVISTPDRRSTAIPHDNPFHSREFDRIELEELLTPAFVIRRWAGQYVDRGGPRGPLRRWLASSHLARILRVAMPRRLRVTLGKAAAGPATVTWLQRTDEATATLLAVAERR